jgi:hypothetical protein
VQILQRNGRAAMMGPIVQGKYEAAQANKKVHAEVRGRRIRRPGLKNRREAEIGISVVSPI